MYLKKKVKKSLKQKTKTKKRRKNKNKMSTASQTRREYKIVVMGEGGVGKTALTIQFVVGHFVEEYDPTIEDAYRRQCVIDQEVALLDLLDTAGQDEYSAMREQYMRNGEGFLIVYSVTSRATFERVEKFFDQIHRVKERPIVPIVIVGTKSDLESQRQVTSKEGKELAKNLNCKFFEASALTRTNVDESFFELVRNIRTYNDSLTLEKGPKSPRKNKKKICSIM